MYQKPASVSWFKSIEANCLSALLIFISLAVHHVTRKEHWLNMINQQIISQNGTQMIKVPDNTVTNTHEKKVIMWCIKGKKKKISFSIQNHK